MHKNELLHAVFGEVRQFFFEAMLHGWASDTTGTKAQTNLFQPGVTYYHYQKVFPFEPIPLTFELSDSYASDEQTGNFFGSIIITIDGKPVWFMHYQGMYPPEANVVLRAAMTFAYHANVFHGGRGPFCYKDQQSGFDYICLVTKNSFEDFCGKEAVLDTRDYPDIKKIGFLEFLGGSLVHDKTP